MTIRGADLNWGIGSGNLCNEINRLQKIITIKKVVVIDPLSSEYPFYGPYNFAGNKPIGAIDLDGLEELIVIKYYVKNELVGIGIIKVSKDKYTSKVGAKADRIAIPLARPYKQNKISKKDYLAQKVKIETDSLALFC